MQPVRNPAFRLLVASDLPSAAGLEAEVFSVPWGLELLESELLRDNTVLLGAFWDDALVGYASLFTVLDEGEITRVAVHPRSRRRGIGRELIVRLLAAGQERALSRLFLEVREGNAAAIALYGGLGFAACGLRPGYYDDNGENAVIMRKDLPCKEITL